MKTVLLTVDALRVDHLGQYGYDRDTMPVVDRLIDDGTRFDNAFANGTNTGVSLPSLLASQYFGRDAARDGPNVATAIRDEGVTTAGFHSNALFANAVGDVAGFQTYDDFDVASESEAENAETIVERAYNGLVDTLRPITERLSVREYAEIVQEAIFPTTFIHEFTVYVNAARLTDEVIEWINDHAHEEFFLWVHYMDPHRPYGKDLDDPAFCDPVSEAEVRDLMSKAGIHPENVSEDERQRMIDLYDSDLRYTSTQVTRLFDELEALDSWDETAIVFTADHGEEFADHGYYYHRNRPYDELIHVPLIVKHPDRINNDPVTEQRELLDVAPTICEWHDVNRPQMFLGTPLFEGKSRDVIATGSFVEQGQVVGGRWDDWKYIHLDGGGEFLYDLETDPEEKQSGASDHPETVAEFRDSIPDAVFAGEPLSIDADDEDVLHRLADLGYLE